ncbi:MAG: pirin-like C-terminal cupin domain-containing protein, partial [Exiguobacterium undae]
RHAEEAVDDDLIHTLQLWLNLPKRLKETTTSYQNVLLEDAPVVPFDGGQVRVYSGDIAGVTGPLDSLVPITMSEIALAPGATYTHVLPTNHNAFMYVLAGEIEAGANKTRLAKTMAATLTFDEQASGDSGLELTAVSRTKILIYSGQPIREETIAYGPFVMNTEDEIRQAYRDYHDGKFGPPAVL